MPFNSDIKLFVSYIARFTSGFELTEEHAIVYVLPAPLTKLIVSLLAIAFPSTVMPNSGVTKIDKIN